MKRFELLDGERIIIEEPIHWKNYIIPGTAMAVLFVLTLLRISNMGYSILNRIQGLVTIRPQDQRFLSIAEVFAMMFFMLATFIRMMRTAYVRYYLTDRRVVSVGGIINRTFSEMLIDRIEMVYLSQSAYEGIYDCGDIVCISAGAKLLLDDVSHALRFKQTVLSLMSHKKET